MNTQLEREYKATEHEYLASLAQTGVDGNVAEFDKVASKYSDLLALGSYMYGAIRQIYGELSGGKFSVLTKENTDQIKIDNSKEKIYVELPVQPDIEEFSGDTAPRKLRGEPYLETGSGRYVKGYFTHLKTPIMEKPLDYMDVYPYDFADLMKKSRFISILKKEDIFGFHGKYTLIGEAESEQAGISILCTTDDAWSYSPHVDVINLMKLHSAPSKKFQPRELLVMPESRYLDFGKVPASVMDDIAKDFLNEGFSPDNSPLYAIKKLPLTDYRGLTYAPHNSRETLFDITGKATALKKEMATLEFFGYNIRTADALPTTRSELANVLRERYGVVYDKESYGDLPDYESKSKFHRILVIAPLNYLGRIFLWKRDVRNHMEVKNEFVTTFSDEKISYMFHNKYAVSALDIWFT